MSAIPVEFHNPFFFQSHGKPVKLTVTVENDEGVVKAWEFPLVKDVTVDYFNPSFFIDDSRFAFKFNALADEEAGRFLYVREIQPPADIIPGVW